MRIVFTLSIILLTLSVFPFEYNLEEREGKDYALFFAVNDYSGQVGYSNLKNPIGDALAIALELEEMYAFETAVYQDPTKNEIYEVLGQWRNRNFGDKDQLFIFFSGHGDFDDFVNKGYFISAGKEGSRIDLTDLGNIITQIPCEHILLAIDACYSGTIDQEIAFKSRDWKRPNADESNKNRLIESWLRNKSRLLLTSGGKNRTPDGTDHSPFSNVFLKGLKEAYSMGDGLFSYQDILSKMERVSPRPHYGVLIGHDEGGFVFVEKQEAKAAINQIETASNICQNRGGDKDGDGLCADEDCNDNNPDIQASSDDDQDGVCNDEDWCYLEAGTVSNHGCPEKNIAKKDGDLNIILPELVLINGGFNNMGSKEGQSDEMPVHRVGIASFYLAKTETTFAQFDAFCEDTGYSKPSDEGWGRGQLPVINVNWFEAISYCNWLSEKAGLSPVYTIIDNNISIDWTLGGFRLPTEAEWEFAAKAGTEHKWAGTSTLDYLMDFGNFKGDDDEYEYTSEVRAFLPNNFGVFDMSGNVWEWCWDWYSKDYYSNSPVTQVHGADSGTKRVLRGGAWKSLFGFSRCADRGFRPPSRKDNSLGFRVAKNINND